MAIQTPATTAREDIRSFYRSTRGRKKNVAVRATEIRNERIIAEDLVGLYQTDPQRALARFEEIKVEARETAESEFPVPVVSADEKKAINRARTLRGSTQRWRHSVRDDFDSQIDKSMDIVLTEVANGKTLIDWFAKCIPSIAEFTGVEGKTSFTDEDVIQSSDYDNVTAKASEVYQSLVSAFSAVLSRWEDMVDACELELDLADGDPLGDIITAAEGLGLRQIFVGSDDGYLWFEDPETSRQYFISIVNQVVNGFSILDYAEIRSEVSMMPNWKELWDVDLSLTALIWASGELKPFESVPRALGTLYDKLRPWIVKSSQNGNMPPAFYPEELTSLK